jgi:hypothetical protein
VKLMLGGPIIAGATLSRFFALHVFVIPGLLIGFVGLHVLMVLKLGINEWPMPGRIVKRATYVSEYHELTQKDGVPFFSYGDVERHVLRGIHHAGSGRVRAVLRAIWTKRQARSDDHPNGSQAGLLFPVALCATVFAAAVARNTCTSRRPGIGNCLVCCCFRFFPARVKKAGSDVLSRF